MFVDVAVDAHALREFVYHVQREVERKRGERERERAWREREREEREREREKREKRERGERERERWRDCGVHLLLLELRQRRGLCAQTRTQFPTALERVCLDTYNS